MTFFRDKIKTHFAQNMKGKGRLDLAPFKEYLRKILKIKIPTETYEIAWKARTYLPPGLMIGGETNKVVVLLYCKVTEVLTKEKIPAEVLWGVLRKMLRTDELTEKDGLFKIAMKGSQIYVKIWLLSVKKYLLLYDIVWSKLGWLASLTFYEVLRRHDVWWAEEVRERKEKFLEVCRDPIASFAALADHADSSDVRAFADSFSEFVKNIYRMSEDNVDPYLLYTDLLFACHVHYLCEKVPFRFLRKMFRAIEEMSLDVGI